MINAPQIQAPTQMPCCGSVNAKAFEILLIIGFILSTAGLTVNFILNMCIFKYSYSIFSLEIVLMALNVFCLIFAIVLRVWRSNGSVLTTSYSSSLCLSSVILVFSIPYMSKYNEQNLQGARHFFSRMFVVFRQIIGRN